MSARDRAVDAVAAQLDAQLDEMAAIVAALNAILIRPGPPEQTSDDERLIAP